MQNLSPNQPKDLSFYLTHRAPLATFDTVDLGDEDVGLTPTSRSPDPAASPIHTRALILGGGAAQRPASLGTKIGGAQSKGKGPAHKSGSDPGEKQDPPDIAQAAADYENVETPLSSQPQQPEPKNLTSSPPDAHNDEDETPTPTNEGPARDFEAGLTKPDTAVDTTDGAAVGSVELEAAGESGTDPAAASKHDEGVGGGGAEASGVQLQVQAQAHAQPPPVPPRKSCPPPPPRIGKIVGSWAHPPDSDSSSSSSDSCSDTITFRPIQGLSSATATQDDDDDDDDTDYTPQTRRRLILRDKSNDCSLNLYPEDLDPSQIASPSKRKAYEKRLKRLQVKTSPRVRPRSTTPINVVTLDEYVLSSPETSPATPPQEKLKISLPCGEHSSRHKNPRHIRRKQSYHHYHRDEANFVFNEEILFSHTRSALVVDKVGQVPPSPRRVLIPPTLSPSTSPKLTRTPIPNSDSGPQLVYITSEDTEKDKNEVDKKKQKEQESENIFGKPAEVQNNENWAVFPEEAESSERSDSSKDEVGSEERVPNSSDSEQVTSEPDTDSAAVSAEQEAEEEILTVNIQSAEPWKPANIEVILSACSSNSPSPSTPDSDEAIKQAAAVETVIPPGPHKPSADLPPAAQPPPIPPRRRPPPPPPPQSQPPPDVVPGDNGADLVTVTCDLLVDIDSQ